MDFFENRYYNVTRICLSLIGLWPYAEPRTKLIRAIFINIIIFVVLAAHVNYKCIIQINTIILVGLNDFDLAVEVLINLFVALCMTIVYYNILFNTSKVHKLLNNIRNDWLEKEGTKEFEIMKEYAEKSRIFSFASLAIYYVALFSIILVSTLPVILDSLRPLNETRVRSLPFPVKCFVDEQKNYIWVAVMSCIVVSIMSLASASSDFLFVILIQHLCGMFYVTGNMLESAFDNKIPVTHDYFESECYDKIILSVKYHKRALEFDAGINSIYRSFLFVLVIIGAFMFAFQFVRVLRTDSFNSIHLRKIIPMILHVVANISILFLKCHLGQKIIDHSIFLSDKAYDIPWYTLSKRSQMLIWFIISRSIRPCYLSIGKSFILSMEFFASILQTSLSYAMVVHSLQ